MTIDAKVHHITKPSANLFLELGFDTTKATHFHAEHSSLSTTPSFSKNSLKINCRIGLRIII